MLLNGRKIAKKIGQQLKNAVKKQGTAPGLAVILVGKNPGSVVYVRLKERAARKIGIKFSRFDWPAKTSQKKILDLIQKLNKNKKIHGIIVQMPLPKHLNSNLIIKTIRPEKDIDGFGHQSPFVSPTHQGILKLIKTTNKNLKNKKAVVLAKNSVFAEPLAKLLTKQGVQVKIKLIKEKKYLSALKKADILVVALGQAKFIKPKMIKRNSIIIDVGYSRVKGKSMGDVDPKVAQKASHLSPVPGGVGPLTVIFLLKNVYLSAKKAKKSKKIKKNKK